MNKIHLELELARGRQSGARQANHLASSPVSSIYRLLDGCALAQASQEAAAERIASTVQVDNLAVWHGRHWVSRDLAVAGHHGWLGALSDDHQTSASAAGLGQSCNGQCHSLGVRGAQAVGLCVSSSFALVAEHHVSVRQHLVLGLLEYAAQERRAEVSSKVLASGSSMATQGHSAVRAHSQEEASAVDDLWDVRASVGAGAQVYQVAR